MHYFILTVIRASLKRHGTISIRLRWSTGILYRSYVPLKNEKKYCHLTVDNTTSMTWWNVAGGLFDK